ncbi:MAG: hypothetical protein FJ100_23505, partial [Deltaproteobacteria bacterium]|nr:hypothetical protein [Deltaproteobacteria bacterium]
KGCTHIAKAPCCGNGTVEGAEECDGGGSGTPACTGECKAAPVALGFAKPDNGMVEVAPLGSGLLALAWRGWTGAGNALDYGVWLALVGGDGVLRRGPVKVNQTAIDSRFLPHERGQLALSVNGANVIVAWAEPGWYGVNQNEKNYKLNVRAYDALLAPAEWATAVAGSYNPSGGIALSPRADGKGWLVCWQAQAYDGNGKFAGKSPTCAFVLAASPLSPVPVPLGSLLAPTDEANGIGLAPQLPTGFLLLLTRKTQVGLREVLLQRLSAAGVPQGTPLLIHSGANAGYFIDAVAADGAGKLAYGKDKEVRIVEEGQVVATVMPDSKASRIDDVRAAPGGGWLVSTTQTWEGSAPANRSDVRLVRIGTDLKVGPATSPVAELRHDQFSGRLATDGGGREALVWTGFDPARGHEVVWLRVGVGACVQANPCMAGKSAGGVCVAGPLADGTTCAGPGWCAPVGTCATGVCQAKPLADGATCPAADACELPGKCTAGACGGKQAVACPDIGACGKGSCDMVQGCVVTPACCGNGKLDPGEDCEPEGKHAFVCTPQCRFGAFLPKDTAAVPASVGQDDDQMPVMITQAPGAHFVSVAQDGGLKASGTLPGGGTVARRVGPAAHGAGAFALGQVVEFVETAKPCGNSCCVLGEQQGQAWTVPPAGGSSDANLGGGGSGAIAVAAVHGALARGEARLDGKLWITRKLVGQPVSTLFDGIGVAGGGCTCECNGKQVKQLLRLGLGVSGAVRWASSRFEWGGAPWSSWDLQTGVVDQTTGKAALVDLPLDIPSQSKWENGWTLYGFSTGHAQRGMQAAVAGQDDSYVVFVRESGNRVFHLP